MTIMSSFASLIQSSAHREGKDGLQMMQNFIWDRILYALVESSEILPGIVHAFWLKYLQKHIFCSECTVTHSKS